MRQKMKREDRAKQFMPFSALNGFEDVIRETGLLGQERIILGEDAQAELDEKLRALNVGDEVELIWHDGFEYVSCFGVFKKADVLKGALLVDETWIDLGDVLDVRGIKGEAKVNRNEV